MRYISPSKGNPVIKSDLVTKMSSLERDNVVVFYNISASEIWSDQGSGIKRGRLMHCNKGIAKNK